MPVEIDASSSHDVVFSKTQALCRKHRLSAYDAAYLELTIRESATLATVDDDLRRAAAHEMAPLV